MHTNEQKPLVSVIMPAYNAQRFIDQAISSVLAQTMTNWELIVIDDCSSDSSYEMALRQQEGDCRIRVLRNDSNCGVAKTRNRGIELAHGAYIAFLDSDDIWSPDKLEQQLRLLTSQNAAICYCSYRIIDQLGNKARPDYIVPGTARFEDILKENYIQCSAMLIPADVVKAHMFNTQFYHEDYILGLDILKNGQIAVGCTQPLLDWRYLENSRSFNKKKSAANRWRIYRKYLRLPLYKAAYLFCCYATAGFRKYFR